jgi:hypothetical protein
LTLEAAETGSISGSVRDDAGGSIPGAVATVKGALLPAGRSVTTDAGGDYRFPNLLPGEYTVRVELAGLGSSELKAVVAVDKDTQLKHLLRASVTREVEVVAASLPMVDVKSTEVAANVARKQFEMLPLARSYSGLFQLAPGVPDNARIAPNGGGNRQDNLFLYDGANVTNPFYGDIFANFAELDIQEVNIKRGGISAEFGRTGGLVVNAVTKAGTNEFNGQARVEYQPASFSAKYQNGVIASTTDSINPGAGIGGPVVKDYVWFYASANFGRATTGDRTNQFNVRPSSSDLPTVLPDQDIDTDEFFGKVTAAPSPSFFLSAAYRQRKATRTAEGICSSCSPSIATDNETENSIIDGGVTWFINSGAYAELKASRVLENNNLRPWTSLGYRPTFDPTRPDLMGQFVTVSNLLVGGTSVAGQTVGGYNLAKNRDDFSRTEVKGSYSYFARFMGSEHEIKVGASYDLDGEELDRVSNGWGTVAYSTSANTCNIGNTGLAAPCFTASYTSAQTVQESYGKTYGLFLQDRISIGNRWNILLGLLANSDEWIAGVPATGDEKTLIKFGFDEMLQPRLGVTFVPDTKAGDKVYANYARYYNADNKSLARAASPYRIYSTAVRFDLTGRIRYEVPASAETGKVILPGLKPMYTDEFLLGYSRPLGNRWSAEIWGQYRQVSDVIEDYPTVDVNTANPKSYVYGNLVNAYRKYRALGIEINKAFSDGWAMSASYSLSRLEGNWDLDQFGDSRFYASSSLQDGPGFYVEDPNRDGILTGDRTHVFKLFGSYEVIKNLTAGGYLRIQSGQPWEARGFGDYAGSNLYIEPAGSRRTATWTNFDLLLSYDLLVAQLFTVRFEGRVLNLLNSQPALTVDNRYRLSNQAVNSLFGAPTSYAAPRRFILAATVLF